MYVVLTVLLVFAGLYGVWRVRYGNPPRAVPQTLCYHKLSTRFCVEGTWITPRRFLEHIDHLRRRGWRFIDEDEYLEAIERPAGERSHELLLTFDDGYEELYDMFLQELVPRRVPIVVSLVTDYAGKENRWDLSLGRRPFRHLSWAQVRAMAARGARFASHGATHADLTRLDAGALEYEIKQSKDTIERELGARVRSFSYPFGRYNGRVMDTVAGAGYDAAFSLYPRHANPRIDRFALRRNGVYVIDTAFSLEHKLEPGPFFWFEEMKCRTINAVAALTPLVKRFSEDRDK